MTTMPSTPTAQNNTQIDRLAAETGLRRTLRQNAAFSAMGGVLAFAGAPPLADLLNVDSWWPVMVIGLGLIGFAALVWWTSNRPALRLVHEALHISVGDISWVGLSVGAIVLGLFGPVGNVVMAAQAATVAWFAWNQLRHRAALSETSQCS